MRIFRCGVVVASIAILIVAAGCGDSRKVVPVSGTLTYKGQPVPGALLNFLPENGRQSWAQTDAQGNFKINYDASQDGAVVGKHKVWIDHRSTAYADQEAMMNGKAPPPPKDLKEFFDKYSYDNSKLEIVIERNTKVLKLDLD